jgi:hypothetical protein
MTLWLSSQAGHNYELHPAVGFAARRWQPNLQSHARSATICAILTHSSPIRKLRKSSRWGNPRGACH